MALRIHIVEDSVYVRSYLMQAIAAIQDVEVTGYSEEADKAVELIGMQRPDVVLLDLALKEGSGLSVLRQIKRLVPAPLVIVLTNHAEGVYRSRSMLEGADYFFDKSLEFELALETIGDISSAGIESIEKAD